MNEGTEVRDLLRYVLVQRVNGCAACASAVITVTAIIKQRPPPDASVRASDVSNGLHLRVPTRVVFAAVLSVLTRRSSGLRLLWWLKRKRKGSRRSSGICLTWFAHATTL